MAIIEEQKGLEREVATLAERLVSITYIEYHYHITYNNIKY